MKAFITHPATLFVGGVLVGYVFQNYLKKVPLVNKLPTPLPPV